jgi:transposase
MARFAVVELPQATPAVAAPMVLLREIAGRLQAQVKQTTRAINRLHNLLARVFPELATLTDDFAAGWVLHLLDHYPTAPKIAQARLPSLEKIPYLPSDKAPLIHEAARQSVGSLRGELTEALVRDLVAQVRQCQGTEQNMRKLLGTAFAELAPTGHVQLVTIPGIGEATAAVLTAKIVDIERFATPDHLVGYFGAFPEENSSGVDKHGKPLKPGTLRMSPKGNDLVRHYLWNAARAAITHNPAIRALHRRLRGKGKRGDVAVGHCMRKLLHLVFAVWKSNRPFDPQHFAWEACSDSPMSVHATPSAGDNNDKAVGHKREAPAEKVVTTASSKVEPAPGPVNPAPAPAPRPSIDFAFLRERVSLEQALRHLGCFDELRGRGRQRRGPCPIHGQAGTRQRTFSVNLSNNIFQCFHGACGAHGNVLDLWAAVHRLPLYDAALHLAETFRLPRNREEETVP